MALPSAFVNALIEIFRVTIRTKHLARTSEASRFRTIGDDVNLRLRVLRVVSIDETGGRGPRPALVRSAAVEQSAAGNASAPIAPGENVLALTLDVVYELGK